MSAVLDGAPETAVEAPAGAKAGGYRRTCPECTVEFLAAQRGQLFCCTKHKRAYNNRWLKRGAVLAPIYAAARETRFGTQGRDKHTGQMAATDANRLVVRWKEEDAAAGRMSAVDYMAARYRLGLVESAC